MPSPFPGMDPYLENPMYWGGFQANLFGRIQTLLNKTMPPGYYAEIDQYVWLEPEEPDLARVLLGKPDTFVTDRNGHPGSAPAGGVAVAEPSARVTMPKAKKRTHRFLKVVSPDHATVVTVVEILSPSNKAAGPDRDKYLAKRDEYLAAKTNLVEIDLLRDNSRMPMGRPAPPAGDYHVFVCRAAEYPAADVWAFTVRDPLPPIPVPLAPADGDVPVALADLVTDIYDTNRYAARIDYAAPLVPALRKTDAVRAAERLAVRGPK